MMQSSEDKNKSISVNIAILTVSDTRTINNDKSGDYLVKSVKQEGHNCTERNIVTDDVGCETIIRYQIDQPNQIYAIGTLTTPISCFGYDDGSAFVYGVGGNDISPATYNF